MKADEELFKNLKKELRAGMKKQLAAMSAEDRRIKSSAIIERLTQLKQYTKSKTVLAYASFGTEVQTDAFLARILKDKKQLALPRLNPFDNSLVLHHVTDLVADLETSKFGIREPRPNLPVLKLKDVQLIAVPGLAFDDFGNRLGRGLGCYDRLIYDGGKKNTFVGLAFDIQIVGDMEIAPEVNDMPMDLVVTESELIDPNVALDAFYEDNKEFVDEFTTLLETEGLDDEDDD